MPTLDSFNLYDPTTGEYGELKVSTKFTGLKNTVTLAADSSFVDIGITNFNPLEDELEVIKNTVQIDEGTGTDEYVLNGGNLRIENPNGLWKSGTSFSFRVLKNVDRSPLPSYDPSLFQDGGFTKVKLAQELQDELDLIPTINTRLADIIHQKENLVNIMYPPSPLVGAKGDNSTDDTVAIQAILDYCGTNGKIAYFPKTTGYKITSGITIKSGTFGIIFEKWSYSGQIIPYGNGYTAVTIEPTVGLYIENLSVGNSTKQTVNGVLFKGHVGINVLRHIRIYNLDGYGLMLNAIWDSLLEDISVELCGNASNYAFSMNDDGDTCNMTHITRLQVEQSNTKAIYISPNSLACVVDNIHSELTTGDGIVYTHILQGNRCTFNNVRIEGGTNELVRIGSAYGSYKDLNLNSAKVYVAYGLRVPMTVENLICDVFNNGDIQQATIRNLVCNIFNDVQEFLIVYNLVVSTTFYYHANNSNCILKIYDSNITVSVDNSYNGKLEIYNSTLSSFTPDYYAKLINCTIGSVTSAYNGKADFYNCTITGNLDGRNNGAFIRLYGTIVLGNVTNSAGNPYVQFDSSCSVTGTVASVFLSPPTIIAWNIGDKQYYPKSVAGGNIGCVCVTAGTPGVWKTFGAISI